jgi:hypothetical protein
MVKSEGGGKAILFENTDTEFPVVTNMMGSKRRMAMALGVERLEEVGDRISALLGDALSPKASLWDKMRMLPLLISLFIMFFQAEANRYSFIAGGANALFYTYVYFQVGLYASAVSALFFSFPIQILTFISWNKHSYEKAFI